MIDEGDNPCYKQPELFQKVISENFDGSSFCMVLTATGSADHELFQDLGDNYVRGINVEQRFLLSLNANII